MNDLGQQILKLEKYYPMYDGRKDDQTRQRFGMSATSSFQNLNSLLNDPEAAWQEPVLINRLRRIRDGQH